MAQTPVRRQQCNAFRMKAGPLTIGRFQIGGYHGGAIIKYPAVLETMKR